MITLLYFFALNFGIVTGGDVPVNSQANSDVVVTNDAPTFGGVGNIDLDN